MPATLDHPPTYVARDGAVWTTAGRRVSITVARELRRFFLDDIAGVEAAYGEKDPVTADALIARDLRLARELRVAIAAAVAFDPEPHVSVPITAA